MPLKYEDMPHRVLKPLLIILICTPSFAQRPFSEISTDYWHDIYSDLQVAHVMFHGADQVEIFLEIMYNNGLGPDAFYPLQYEQRLDFQTEQNLSSDTVNMASSLITRSGNKYYFRFPVTPEKDASLLMLTLTKVNPNRSYYYPISLDPSVNFSNDGIYLASAGGDHPIFRSFIHADDTFRISHIADQDPPAHVYYYNDVFDAALPPMVVENTSTGKGFDYDSLFTVPMDEDLVFGKEGLYFIQSDTSSLHGVGLRVVDRYYPTMNKVDELTEPLLYISTKEEMEALVRASDKRGAFEEYWVKMAGNPAQASQMIKKFYSQVEAANYFFTTYEEGWKTDMGMIYIVYGKPDEIYHNAQTIDWVYNRNLAMPIIRFTFIKVKSIFSDRYYSLMRKKNYDRNWFMSVKLWRDGKK
jgi:GWxTD domain-containing protein